MVTRRIELKAQRLMWQDKTIHFYRQSKIFRTDAKTVYREIGQNNVEADCLECTNWRLYEFEEHKWYAIETEVIKYVLRKYDKRKTLGLERIANLG